MPTSHSTVQNVNVTAANTAQPIHVYLGWEIFLNRVCRDRTDKGLWLHWYHPADRNREPVLRYGCFIAPSQTLEEAFHAVYQSIEAIVELEAMGSVWSLVQTSDRVKADRELLSVNV